MNMKIFGILFYISGFLLVLIILLFNPIEILIDTLVLIGMFFITLFFIICHLKMSKKVIKNDN